MLHLHYPLILFEREVLSKNNCKLDTSIVEAAQSWYIQHGWFPGK